MCGRSHVGGEGLAIRRRFHQDVLCGALCLGSVLDRRQATSHDHCNKKHPQKDLRTPTSPVIKARWLHCCCHQIVTNELSPLANHHEVAPRRQHDDGLSKVDDGGDLGDDYYDSCDYSGCSNFSLSILSLLRLQDEQLAIYRQASQREPHHFGQQYGLLRGLSGQVPSRERTKSQQELYVLFRL